MRLLEGPPSDTRFETQRCATYCGWMTCNEVVMEGVGQESKLTLYQENVCTKRKKTIPSTPPPDVLCHIANAVEEPKIWDLLSFESIFRKYHDFESAWFEQCQRHLASFHEVTKALPMLYAPWSDLAPTSISGQFRQKYAPYARTWKECFKMNHHPSHWYTERPDLAMACRLRS